MNRLVNIVTVSFIIINTAYAQENCTVSVDALKGSYTGDCVDGKASGKGKAVGLDSYEGQFKNGFPEGSGTYTWADKSTYSGTFRKGSMDGKGEMRYTKISGADSVLTGFWKKNKFIGAYEKPFTINDRSGKVNKVDVMLIRKGERAGSININSSQMSSVSNYNANGVIPTITDVQVVTGQYISKTASNISKTAVIRLQQMIFPFRARFIYSSGEIVDITFNEQADYEVNVVLL
ncbi:MAG: hypothetical protein H7Y86_17085 [Rhizobacter sp.]|nr:hypothetical protein [Ferruginibacter sp.]